jgi:hypothetical protein
MTMGLRTRIIKPAAHRGKGEFRQLVSIGLELLFEDS